MGSIHPYQSAQGKRYRVIFRKPDHAQGQKRGFKTKRDAEIFLASVEVSKHRGDFIDPSAGLVKIEVFGADWLAAQSHLKPSTFRSTESTWRCWVLPRWGRVPLAEVGYRDVQDWTAEIGRLRSPTTVIRAFGVLAGLLDAAVRDRRIHSNPARGVKMPRKQRKRRTYLSHSQVQTLVGAARSRGPLIRFLSYTGLRWGEASGIHIEDVDFERRRIQIIDNAVDVGGKVVVGSPKAHRVRSVPIPSFLADELQQLAGNRPRASLLFTGPDGGHIRLPHSTSGWLASAVRRIQRTDPEFPRVTPHDLRHTAASLAVAAGANVKVVQRMLGHASAAMTLDIYADLFEDNLDEVADAMDAARIRALDDALRSGN